MQAGFLVEVLTWETRVVFKQLTVAVRILVREISTKRMHVLPAPDDGVGLIHDHPRGVEVVGVDVVHLYFTGSCGFSDYADRNITQPDGFLPYQPIVSRCGCSSIVLIISDQLPRWIIEEQKPRTQRAVFDDTLIPDEESLSRPLTFLNTLSQHQLYRM